MAELSEKAQKIAKMKYFKGDKETWDDLSLRVSSYIASAEITEELKKEYTRKFFELISELTFIPGAGFSANSGTNIKNLFNCFVLGIEDSREGIYDSLKNAAEIFAHGGGCGYNFSHIREEGARINSTRGKASGPLSFATMFNYTGEVIQQASRRGAQLMILNVDHPDIEKFIDFKSTLMPVSQRILESLKSRLGRVSDEDIDKTLSILENTLLEDQLTHFNISVGVYDRFMRAVDDGEAWDLVSPATGEVVKTLDAGLLLKSIAKQAWKSGDPGLFFLDRFEEDNMVPYVGKIESGNPCSEIGLIAGEACCLGSINLSKFFDPVTKEVKWDYLEYTVRTAIRFLDNVHDLSDNKLDKINEMSRGLRRVGLGVMGFADLLAELGMEYGSPDSIEFAEYLSWFINFMAWQASADLGEERGGFPFFEKDKVNLNVVSKVFKSKFCKEDFGLENLIFRNVAVTALAPTGTLALLAGVNSGIEPFFALAYKRNITEGIANIAKDVIIEINPVLLHRLREDGFSSEEIEEVENYIIERGTIKNYPKLEESFRKTFRTALDLSFEKHIAMQAAWQKYISNAISKTINLPKNATEIDIFNAILLMWRSGLKSSTVYRDGSKSFQILNILKNKK